MGNELGIELSIDDVLTAPVRPIDDQRRWDGPLHRNTLAEIVSDATKRHPRTATEHALVTLSSTNSDLIQQINQINQINSYVNPSQSQGRKSEQVIIELVRALDAISARGHGPEARYAHNVLGALQQKFGYSFIPNNRIDAP